MMTILKGQTLTLVSAICFSFVLLKSFCFQDILLSFFHLDTLMTSLIKQYAFLFNNLPFCLYSVQILDSANWEQRASFATFYDDLPYFKMIRIALLCCNWHLSCWSYDLWENVLYNSSPRCEPLKWRLINRFNLMHVFVVEQQITVISCFTFLEPQKATVTDNNNYISFFLSLSLNAWKLEF